MDLYSGYINKLIDELSGLPGIGSKSAQRLAFHLIGLPEAKVNRIANAMIQARQNVRYCKECFTLTDNELCPMEPVILLGIALKEAVAQNRLRRVLPLLIIQAVNAAEIRYPALGADSCAAEKHDIVALRDPFFKLFNLRVHWLHLHSTPINGDIIQHISRIDKAADIF